MKPNARICRLHFVIEWFETVLYNELNNLSIIYCKCTDVSKTILVFNEFLKNENMLHFITWKCVGGVRLQVIKPRYFLFYLDSMTFNYFVENIWASNGYYFKLYNLNAWTNYNKITFNSIKLFAVTFSNRPYYFA